MRAHGLIVALHTPLTPSGEIHEEALRDYLEWMVQLESDTVRSSASG
jgi:dihydrodipicolinate synthase/N-acetylneuraminate lyase